MRGITAHFTIDKFFGAEKKDIPKKRARSTKLIVQTRGYRVPTEIMFYGDRSGINNLTKETGQPKWECDGPTVSAESEPQKLINPPKIHVVSPAMAYICAQKETITFVIEGVNLEDYPNPTPINQERLAILQKDQGIAFLRKDDLEYKISTGSQKSTELESWRMEVKKIQKKLSEIHAEQQKLLPILKPEVNIFWGGAEARKKKIRRLTDDTDVSFIRSVDVVEATFDLPLALKNKDVGMSLNQIRVPISIATKSGIDSQDVIVASCATRSVPMGESVPAGK